MEFLFECSTRYLTRSLRSLVRYKVEHEKRNSISNHTLLFVYCINIQKMKFSTIFRPLSEDSPKIIRRPQKLFRRLPKKTEDCRRLLRKNDRALYTNKFNYTSRVKNMISVE